MRVAVQNTERLTRLINDLLDIERMESGARPMETTALDARYLLSSAVHQIEGLGGVDGRRGRGARARTAGCWPTRTGSSRR